MGSSGGEARATPQVGLEGTGTAERAGSPQDVLVCQSHLHRRLPSLEITLIEGTLTTVTKSGLPNSRRFRQSRMTRVLENSCLIRVRMLVFKRIIHSKEGQLLLGVDLARAILCWREPSAAVGCSSSFGTEFSVCMRHELR